MPDGKGRARLALLVLGKDLAPPSVQARLVEFADLGHAPQIQAPDRFHKALLDGLLPGAPMPGR